MCRAFVRTRCNCVRFPAQVSALFVIPRGVIVSARCRVKPGVQSVLRQFESFLNDECSIRVVDEIFSRDPVVLDGITNQPAEECDVSAGANLKVEVGGSGRASESRVYGNQLGVAVALGLHRPLESAGMV